MTVTALVENRKAQLIATVRGVNPSELLVFPPALRCEKRFPSALSRGGPGWASGPQEDLHHCCPHTEQLRRQRSSG
ncbi:unnamed protein product [Gulo gulo]|uniref:Uncharacterized protein n=1 Tax=Gulo gulo TaxID=48420 RepID=A0A9X9PU71_GULGU|nr:unnamed protein product [Gulo gulo]